MEEIIYNLFWEGEGGYTAQGFFSFDAAQEGVVTEDQLIDFDISFFDPQGAEVAAFIDNFPFQGEFNFNFDTATDLILQSENYDDDDNGLDLGIDFGAGETGVDFYTNNEDFPETTIVLEQIITAGDDENTNVILDQGGVLQAALQPVVGISVEPTSVGEDQEQYTVTVTLDEAAPPGGLDVLWTETDSDNVFGDVEDDPELTNISNLLELDPVGDETGRTQITIEEGATTASVTYTTIADGIVEGPETSTLELLVQEGYSIDAENQVAQVVVNDTDEPTFGDNADNVLAGTEVSDFIVGLSGNDKLYGRDGDDVLDGRLDNDHLFGGNGNDFLKGGQGRDRLNGGRGNDVLQGGASIDRFIFNTNVAFNSDDIGVDNITDFQPDLRPDEAGNQGDLILLDKRTFIALASDSGIGFSVDDDFEIVNSDAGLVGSDAVLIYNEGTGNLFYNNNGSKELFAILDGTPTITEDNFQIR